MKNKEKNVMKTAQEETTNPAPAHRRLRTRAAAEYIGVSKSSLEKWRVSGRGPRYCKIGRVVVYPTNHLDQWLDGNLRKSTSDRGTQPA